jgi:hypothetical protein
LGKKRVYTHSPVVPFSTLKMEPEDAETLPIATPWKGQIRTETEWPWRRSQNSSVSTVTRPQTRRPNIRDSILSG